MIIDSWGGGRGSKCMNHSGNIVCKDFVHPCTGIGDFNDMII